ncbi:[FeFe] hydrogenase H-cluster maturation GTPase HydF [bacterium]|nr:[FeFe] hydrogenase H-cluster maturation GTPase HydF [bacterium]MBU1064388.1 [FeFe] hydrogenase H-cluster maturation GTPase HydF [bacterium]MBU1635801.1 [FeFe] hydrogenase H-cluster maturation GTPase HydF [bacterium]MBU1873959.1 [FeFe] hydrogenase H-cluster maturation GTPase HydF [bacterium]
MQKTPKGLRLHIGIFGRRNVGKSSLLNALTRQTVSIVSDVAGTTTDPVEKPMELLPIGPVVFIDTAGVDDVGILGDMRTARTKKIFNRSDLAIIVAAGNGWSPFEEELLKEFTDRNVPVIIVFNKVDLESPGPELTQKLNNAKYAVVQTVAVKAQGLFDLREAIIKQTPQEIINSPAIISDLIQPGDMAILVVPIDKEAPKGRLILPQVQTIRDILDSDAYCMVVKERELRDAFQKLNSKPAIVITDSQAFLKVADDTPNDIPMTSFSILFARVKGNLSEFVRGAMLIDELKPGDNVLIAESCSHHPITDDIGTVKIPRWLNQYVGGKINFSHTQGHDFPEDLQKYKLIIHCGSCMFNRREVLSRIMHAKRAGIPITNYGLTIAYSLGIFERALSPFPGVLEMYRKLKK